MDKPDRSKTLVNSILSGACSGGISAVLFQPLEYLKTKLQQPTFKYSFKSLKTYTMKQLIIITITDQNQQIKFNNLKKFWSGLTPSLVRSVPVAGIYFGCIDTFKNSERFGHSKKGGNYEILHSFLIGSLSKVIADVSTFPLGLIKTRYESEVYNYRGISSAFFEIVKSDGVFGLYKGLSATLARDITYSGLYFTLYTKVKHMAKESGAISESEKPIFFATCALISSLLACAFTQPPDAIRAYIQLDPYLNRSFITAAQNIYDKNGFKGFFAGFVPRAMRRTMISVMSWTLYEKLTLVKKEAGQDP